MILFLVALMILLYEASSPIPEYLKTYHKTSLDFEPVCVH